MRVLGYFLDSFATDAMFQSDNGDRANVPNYLVIITDGNSANATETWNEAMRARAQDINIVTVSNSVVFLLTIRDQRIVFSSHDIVPYRLTCCTRRLAVAVSQRHRAMLRIIEYFAKSLKFTQGQ